MKTYVITLSKTFPEKHPRKGEPTNFNAQLLNAVCRAHNMSVGFPQFGMKLHTIRANYDLWSNRFKQIEACKAVLSVRYWTGKPYHSKQMEICKLTKEDGIGVQKLELKLASYLPFYIEVDRIDEDRRKDVIHVGLLAHNDGLSLNDWNDWFRNYDLSKPLAIIHFTPFRYLQ